MSKVNSQLFVDVIVPLSVPELYTYAVNDSDSLQLTVGQRVIISFGKGNKFYTAIVRTIHHNPPKHYQAKYIEAILDDTPSVHEIQLKFWEWMATYYMCHIGEVMNAALPSGLSISSETTIVLNTEDSVDLYHLDGRERMIVDALEARGELTLKDVSEILDLKSVNRYVKSLIDRSVISLVEEIRQRYRPKLVAYVCLTDNTKKEAVLQKVLDDLQRAPKQFETLMTYLQMKAESDHPFVNKIQLQKRAGVTASVINQLVKKDVFVIEELESGRLPGFEGELSKVNALNKHQQKAYDEISDQFNKKDVVLIHGVTSSGKTELYIKMIKKVIDAGKQVLYLLPEIALTTQLIMRLKKFFGDDIGVYHSRFNANERVELWNTVLKGHDVEGEVKCRIVMGARSALFLPFNNLGLIIVDEEHENSFKQYDPAPRYNARDAATVLAKMHNAKVLMGSATPAVESFWNAKEGLYGFAEIRKRHRGMSMPEVLCADLSEATKKKKLKGHFTPLLMEMMEEAFENDEQVILFQNRRGYAPILICEMCGHVPHCTNCDVALTYHKLFNNLICHYCNYTIPIPNKCQACGSGKVSLKGFGTEQIEEELAIYFPDKKVARMDYDTTRQKHAYQNIIENFQNRDIDVLVGTQMVTKGLDFDNVAVVGILNADYMLQFPDFRAFERSFQLMSQVAGRAGRKKKRGRVLIQAYNPHHDIIRDVIDHDYHAMYERELIERRNYLYPPFCRIIRFTLMHRDRYRLDEAVEDFNRKMFVLFGERLLGPQVPAVSRVRKYYLKNFVLKIEKGKSLRAVKEKINNTILETEKDSTYKGIRIKIDVDPM